jgi:hypothetical protein
MFLGIFFQFTLICFLPGILEVSVKIMTDKPHQKMGINERNAQYKRKIMGTNIGIS